MYTYVFVHRFQAKETRKTQEWGKSAKIIQACVSLSTILNEHNSHEFQSLRRHVSTDAFCHLSPHDCCAVNDQLDLRWTGFRRPPICNCTTCKVELPFLTACIERQEIIWGILISFDKCGNTTTSSRTCFRFIFDTVFIQSVTGPLPRNSGQE